MLVPRWHDPDRKARPPIAEAIAAIAAPPDRVAAALFTVGTGRVYAPSLPLIVRAPYLMPRGRLGVVFDISGGPDRFTILPRPPAAGRATHIDIDRPALSVAVHGGWWFRHEFRVEDGAFPGFATIVCRTYNVAPGMSRRLLPLALPRVNHRARAAETLNGLLALVAREIGAPAVPATIGDGTPRRGG